MTMSFLSSFGPGAVSPAMILTRATRASLKTTPMKDRFPSPGEAGALLEKSNSPWVPKYSIRVLAKRFPVRSLRLLPSGESTSVKTTPKPVEVAGVLPLLPGTESSTSVTLLPIGENSRSGLNAWKMVA
jgi:hypothetical protein